MPVLTLIALILIIGLCASLMARLVTAYSIQLAVSANLMAEVNERSSHDAPTPRLGGIGLVAGLVVGYVVLALMLWVPAQVPQVIEPVLGHRGSMDSAMWGGMVLATLIAFAMGLWDDRSNPHPLIKLTGQMVVAIIPPLLGWRITHLHFPGMHQFYALPDAVAIVLSIIWILFMMNAVNFMDGINGLAGRFGEVVALCVLVSVATISGGETAMVLAVVLYGACNGFLVYNRPAARTFMGDCGSQPLGLIVALLGIHVATIPTTYQLPFLGFLLIVSVFAFDVIYTLLARLLRGENILRPHRDHLYQQFLKSHDENHEATLGFVETKMYITGICGVLYLMIGYEPHKWPLQALLVAATAVTLGCYLVKAKEPPEVPETPFE